MTNPRHEELIRKLIANSEDDRLAGASLVSEFIQVYRSLSEGEQEKLGASLVHMVKHESNKDLAAVVWLAGALAANNLTFVGLADALRMRLDEAKRSPNEGHSHMLIEDIEYALRLILEKWS